jgi:hypothetical protein
MNIKEQLQSDLKDAMRSGDQLRKNTLRMALSAINLAEIEKKSPNDDASTLAIIQKEVKSRREAITPNAPTGPTWFRLLNRKFYSLNTTCPRHIARRNWKGWRARRSEMLVRLPSKK